MLIELQIKHGQIQNMHDNFLQDNIYFCRLIPFNPNKTVEEARANYFAEIDEFANKTGQTRYEVHEMFKQEAKIETTKNLTLKEWAKLLEHLKYYLFNQYA